MGRLSRPVLTTERLRLEPLGDEHTELLVELDSDPEVMRFLLGRASTREESLAWMPRRTRPEADERGIGYWVGRDAAGTFLGWWCLAVDDDDPGTAELGYRLHREAWDRGYATEGSRALLSHAFETLALPSVWAETMVVNTGSRAVMEKLGLRHVLTEVRSWDAPLPGWEQGEVRYVMTATDYRATYQDV